ncbi:MAG: ABC transporter substrate-binding protein [Gemmatimonadetes bacterium]|nr:ABC transporter substrate-binding protein [Gemmatimonadota bacterium]
MTNTPRNRFTWLVALATALAASPACEPGDGRADGDGGTVSSVVDAAGHRHDVREPRVRVVSLVPAVTETIESMGLRTRVAARTRYDEQPSLAHLPSVGGGLDPNLELLAALSPDLVVAWRDAGGMGSLSGRLRELGIPVYQVEVESIEAYRYSTRNLARLLHALPVADSLLAAVDAELTAVSRTVEGRPSPSALFLVQRDPPMAAGPGTFIDSLLAVAGAANVFEGVTEEWPMISLEDVLWRDPEFLVLPVVGLGDARDARREPPVEEVETLLASAGWREVRAVAERRVIAVDAGLFARPGPAMGRAAASLADHLHQDRPVDPRTDSVGRTPPPRAGNEGVGASGRGDSTR